MSTNRLSYRTLPRRAAGARVAVVAALGIVSILLIVFAGLRSFGQNTPPQTPPRTAPGATIQPATPAAPGTATPAPGTPIPGAPAPAPGMAPTTTASQPARFEL